MRLSVRGAELAYSIAGRGPDCLVLSVMGTQPYERQTRELGRHFRLIHVALRGSGESSGDPEDLSFDVLSEDLEALCSELRLSKVIVLGHSILGVLAVEYGRRCPHRVSHVVMAGTPPRGDMQWLAAEQAKFFEEDASVERKRLMPKPEDLAKLPPLEAILAQTPMRFFEARLDAAPLYAGMQTRIEMMYHLMGTLTSGWNIADGAASLTVPMLLTHGRHDYVVPYRVWEPVMSSMPLATFRLFERSGHQPFYEEPHEFATALTAWLRSH